MNNISFKDMIQNEKHSSNASASGFPTRLEMNYDDEISNDDDERCPAILLTREEKKRIRGPWRTSLIIKMFDGMLGYMALMCRL